MSFYVNEHFRYNWNPIEYTGTDLIITSMSRREYSVHIEVAGRVRLRDEATGEIYTETNLPPDFNDLIEKGIDIGEKYEIIESNSFYVRFIQHREDGKQLLLGEEPFDDMPPNEEALKEALTASLNWFLKENPKLDRTIIIRDTSSLVEYPCSNLDKAVLKVQSLKEKYNMPLGKLFHNLDIICSMEDAEELIAILRAEERID